jgi:N,N-dimethylformamidase beta subunit-like, C-terminal
MKHKLAVIGAILTALSAPTAAFGDDNLIVQENKRAGSTVWLLNDNSDIRPYTENGWRREKAIEGYCSHATIRAGETLTVYVSTDPASEFQVDFYRLGYYGGKGGRLVLSKGPLAGEPQPTPQDGQKALIECHWKPALTVEIPQGWISGVYLGKLTALDSKAEAYVVFIVRDDRKADLVFQCSDLTWQSYNRWPAWRSLYDFRENKWHTTPGDDVGFDRPYAIYYNGLPADFLPISNGSGEFLLWEFPLAFWLEKEGYDVTYISNIDTHVDAGALLRGKGFLSVGHDEYWTQQMYDNVSRARDEGVGLAFFSGNSISGRIYLNPSTDGRPNRVFGRIDRFKGEEELMGCSSYGVGMADWVCEKPDHWVFAGTEMKKGDAIPNLVGWEYHGQPVGSSPSMVVLATSPIRGRPNSPPHTGTIYEGPKGNVVFNAGTCWWNMVLSSPPGFINPPNRDFSNDDPRVQQITRNILDRMIKGNP